MSKGHIRAALFDFDGTLAHLTIDFGRMRQIVRAELAAILGPDHPALARRDLPVMELIYTACEKQPSSVRDEVARRSEAAVSAYEVEAASRCKLFEFTRPLLMALRRQQKDLAIVTRNCRAAIETVFPDHAEFCRALICRGDVPPEALKPHPGQLHAALNALECPPAQALMLGDHPMDIISGKAAGCLTAGVLSGNADREKLEQAGPDWLAEDAAELFKELGLFS